MKTKAKGGLSSVHFIVETIAYLMQNPYPKHAQYRPHVVSSRRVIKKPFYWETFPNSEYPKTPSLDALMTCVEEGGVFLISLRELPLFKAPPRPIRPLASQERMSLQEPCQTLFT